MLEFLDSASLPDARNSLENGVWGTDPGTLGLGPGAEFEPTDGFVCVPNIWVGLYEMILLLIMFVFLFLC
jgi:hypothetical protein